MPLFKYIFLRKLVKNVMPVSMVYLTVMGTVDQSKSVKTLQAKEFIENISIDHYGNTREKLFLNINEHSIQFSQQSCSHSNVATEESLQNIKKYWRKYEMMSYRVQKTIQGA